VTSLSVGVGTEPRWLTEVRLRARLRALWCRELWTQLRYDGEEALAISHSGVDAALAAGPDLRGAEQMFYDHDGLAQVVRAELALLAEHGPDPRWVELCNTLGLERAEQELLALALAAELEPALRRVYGYLEDETLPLDPTTALAADIWGRPLPLRLDNDSPLLAWALVRRADPAGDPASPGTAWIADPLVLDFLLGSGREHGPFGAVVHAPRRPLLYAEAIEDVTRFVGSTLASGAHVEIELVAPAGTGRASLAAAVAGHLGSGVVAVDSAAVAAAPDPATAAAREVRCARLAGMHVAWRDADQLPAHVLDGVGKLQPLAFLLTEQPLPAPAAKRAIRRAYVLPALDRARRIALWTAGAGGPVPEPVAEWPLRAAEIETLLPVASAGDDAVRAVCRRLLLEAPHHLLTPVELPYTWADFVVSPQLETHLYEFEAQARRRGEVLDDWGLRRLTPLGRGVTALFAGPSGTGKTMAAQVLARSLGLDLYRVDLAGVVNKYIGETEKHLRAVFAVCERAPVMLFFDEADALFGRRMQVNDAHDRFANIEVDYLLQLMEQFDGVAVLATNRKGDLDTSFMRRLRFTIDFAPPTNAERELLWRRALEGSVDAAQRPLVGAVDWAALARELDLTGAGIKNAALAAAFLARSEQSCIEQRHLLAASRRELEKEGIVVRSRLEAVL